MFLSFFWRLESRHHATLALQYKSLAERIRAQNDLLRTVTERTLDLITLKGKDGRYELVSRSFAENYFAKSPESLIGFRDEDLLSRDACAQLAQGEQVARQLGMSLRDDVVIDMAGRQLHLHVVQVPVGSENGEETGMLTVARDITDLVIAREDKERYRNKPSTPLCGRWNWSILILRGIPCA